MGGCKLDTRKDGQTPSSGKNRIKYFSGCLSLREKPRGGIEKEEIPNIVYETMVYGDSPENIKTLRKMLSDKNPQQVRNGVAAAVYLDNIPPDFIQCAREILSDDGREELRDVAGDFIQIIQLKNQLDRADDSQFAAALMLIGFYDSGRSYLRPMLYDVAEEMEDVGQEPAGEKEEEQQVQRYMADYVLKQLSKRNIQPSSAWPHMALRVDSDFLLDMQRLDLSALKKSMKCGRSLTKILSDD